MPIVFEVMLIRFLGGAIGLCSAAVCTFGLFCNGFAVHIAATTREVWSH